MLTKKKKANAMKEVAMHESDTGSPEVQIAILSKRIDELTSHLKKNADAKTEPYLLPGLMEKYR
jgi:small subunit ribosomal protein S15